MVYALGSVARALWFVGAAWIVAAAVIHYWAAPNYAMAIAAAVFFPITYFIYPWTHHALEPLWIVFVAASALYVAGSLAGHGPVE